MTAANAGATPCWIRPDGTLLSAPGGLGAPIAPPGGGAIAPGQALALGWVGVRPTGDDAWWEILPPTVATTRRAHEATARLVRRTGQATPAALAGALIRLLRLSWDSDRYADPGSALAALRTGVLATRLHDAVDAALERTSTEGLMPDIDRLDAAHAILTGEVSDLYETAHAWRHGPTLRAPADGRWSEDPTVRRAGARAAAGRILASVERMEAALRDSRLAALGVVPPDVPPPPPVEILPGETAPAALMRLLAEREADVDQAVRDKGRRGAATDALPAHLRPAARLWTDAVSGTLFTVSRLRTYAETYLCQAERLDPGDDGGHRDLASHLISHECGRTALELRQRIRRTLAGYLDRLREAAASEPTASDGARP